MTVQIELWHLVTLLLAFFGCVAGFAKLVLAQMDKRLDERFAAQETARQEGSRSLRSTIDAHLAEEKLQAARITAVETCTSRELHEIGQRLSGVEASLEHGFGRADAEKIYERINEVAEDLSGLKGEFRGVNDALRLLMNKITERGLS